MCVFCRMVVKLRMDEKLETTETRGHEEDYFVFVQLD